MITPPPHGRRHAGFTLFELLLVLAILAIVLGMAIPALRRLARRSEVQDAARQLRVTLLQARLRAIESGVPRWFRYQRGASAWEVAAAGGANAGAAAPAGAPEDADRPQAGAPRRPLAVAQTLPAGVRFLDPSADPARSAASGSTGDESHTDWSEAVLFLPNGRADNARFRLGNDQYWMDITVRGLTGRVQIGPVQHAEETAAAPLPDFSSEEQP
jgi:type II secretion system protein H